MVLLLHSQRKKKPFSCTGKIVLVRRNDEKSVWKTAVNFDRPTKPGGLETIRIS